MVKHFFESDQAAEMVLAPGDLEGGPDNSHRGTDPWLFVISGTGVAVINGNRPTPRARTLALSERGQAAANPAEGACRPRATCRRPGVSASAVVPFGDALPRSQSD